MREHISHQPAPMEVDLARAAQVFTRVPRVLSMYTERIDSLDETTLRKLTQFPTSAESALTQNPPSLPISSYPELFTKEALDYFRTAVTASCGEIDPQMHLARADIATVSGAVLHRHPVHVFTSFSHNGERFAGSFFGSISNSMLVFGNSFPFEARREFIEALVETFCVIGGYRGVAIAFPQRMIASNSGVPAPAVRSASYEILSGPRLQFVPFNVLPTDHTLSPLQARTNQLFFFRGETSLLERSSFLEALITIRRIRSEQLEQLSSQRDFSHTQLVRDEIRAACITTLFAGGSP